MDIQKLLKHVKPVNNKDLSMMASYNIIRTLNVLVTLDKIEDAAVLLDYYVDSLIEDFTENGVMLSVEKDDVTDLEVKKILHILKYTLPNNATNLLAPALIMNLNKDSLYNYKVLLINNMIQGNYKKMREIVDIMKITADNKRGVL